MHDESVAPAVRALRARAVEVPLARPLVTSSGVIATAPLVLVDLLTAEGVTGSAYAFCYTPAVMVPLARLVANLEPLVRGERLAPLALERRLQEAFRLLGGLRGLSGMAVATIDMAAWDGLARALGRPLVRLLGGEPRPLPAYNSLGRDGADVAAADAEATAAAGFRAIKVKVGYADRRTDVEVVRAVRRASEDRLRVMVDYNQSLSVPEAVTRARALEPEGLTWIEEPTLAHDLAGHARVAREVATPIQLGENWWGPSDVADSIAAGASDCAMLDAGKLGVTGWLRAAALAGTAGLPVSSHVFPEISAHLLSVTPTCDWLEYLDTAGPVLCEPVRVEDGTVRAGEAPGTGVAWDEEAVRRYLVE